MAKPDPNDLRAWRTGARGDDEPAPLNASGAVPAAAEFPQYAEALAELADNLDGLLQMAEEVGTDCAQPTARAEVFEEEMLDQLLDLDDDLLGALDALGDAAWEECQRIARLLIDGADDATVAAFHALDPIVLGGWLYWSTRVGDEGDDPEGEDAP